MNLSLAEETHEDFDAAFARALADRGLRIDERGGLRLVARDPTKPTPCPATSNASPSDSSPERPVPPSTDRDALADSIDRVSDTHFRIERHGLDSLVGNQTMFLRGLRAVPEIRDGKSRGTRLFRVPATPLAHLGFANGDVIEKVNGVDIGAPDRALEAYSKLRSATSLEVSLLRKEQVGDADDRHRPRRRTIVKPARRHPRSSGALGRKGRPTPGGTVGRGRVRHTKAPPPSTIRVCPEVNSFSIR